MVFIDYHCFMMIVYLYIFLYMDILTVNYMVVPVMVMTTAGSIVGAVINRVVTTPMRTNMVMERVIIPMPGPVHMATGTYMNFNKNITSLEQHLEK